MLLQALKLLYALSKMLHAKYSEPQCHDVLTLAEASITLNANLRMITPPGMSLAEPTLPYTTRLADHESGIYEKPQ